MKNKIKPKKNKKKKEPNWHNIIALASAGKYIQDRLNEELLSITSKAK